ncbi:MAG: hypothetical protein Q9176_002397 [Flavoplaca citrina]
MFAKSALLAALFAASTQLVSATVPPGCFIAAVNTRPDPSKLGLICGSDSGKVESAISETCNTAEHEEGAMAAFEDYVQEHRQDCLSSGVAGSTGFATGTAVPVPTGSGAAGSGPGATGSPILPSAPIDSGNAGGAPFTGAATKTVGSLAAAALAFVGLALTL